MDKPMGTLGKSALILLGIALLALLVLGLTASGTTQPLYVHTTYYLLMATVLCWAGVYLHSARSLSRETVIAWVKDNGPGLLVALVVTLIAALAVHPALRVLSDETNLVGTSKNLFTSQTATFTVSGKNYYDSYWNVDVIIDQRPALFPFLVSLVHVVLGYSYKNAFILNLLLLPVFVLLTYRLAKSLIGKPWEGFHAFPRSGSGGQSPPSPTRLIGKPWEGFHAFPRSGSGGQSPPSPTRLGGEVFALVASLLVVAHPITLIAVRSGGFDFLAVFFSLLVIKSLLDFDRDRSPGSLAVLWMNLCMFAEIRYESVLFLPPIIALLFLFRMVTWTTLRPYAFIYVLTPAYLAPRLWQAVLLGSVPRQEPGTTTFSLGNFFNNTYEYFKPVLSPFHSYPAHARIPIALGLVGCALWLASYFRTRRSPDAPASRSRFPAFVVVWMLAQAVILFTYWWGKSQSPIASRLAIPIDTFFSFAAAWALVVLLRRWSRFIPVMLAAAVLAVHVPVAAQARMLNKLTQTRENATTWRFFESLHEKRILIVTDRPSHFTVMDYGAMNFEGARNDPYLFQALDRRLFYDVYVVQQISVSTGQPLPGYETWTTRRLEPMLEFQNDANVLVRISRVAR
jgi:hypothetical protein